jgi:cysteinyl-tRNA synthetase
MDALNVKRPSIEPRASGHIIEQIEVVKKLLEAGYAYESNGSVYFDVRKYNDATGKYGCLSGRVIDELLSTTRELDGQSEKHNTADFALWKNASPEHIMRWNSPWGVGFPGWHTECTAMGTKYLGETFDIHGGGMDLLFPHHESEIAQQTGITGHGPCKYWMHNNMITINGQKMGKSLGNFITLGEFFEGSHNMLEKAYSPMTIRFFILQAHYRSTVDFSNEALQAAEKGFGRLMQAYKTLQKLQPAKTSSVNVSEYRQKCYDAMNDDLNSPILIAHLFDITKVINSANDKKETLTQADIDELKSIFNTFVFDILGLKDEQSGDNTVLLDGLISMILDVRQQAKSQKDWTTSDRIRDELQKLGVSIKDGKDGATWTIE